MPDTEKNISAILEAADTIAQSLDRIAESAGLGDIASAIGGEHSLGEQVHGLGMEIRWASEKIADGLLAVAAAIKEKK